jgi:hypothetical protein
MLGVFAEFERSRNEFVRAWRGQGCGDEAGAPVIPHAKREPPHWPRKVGRPLSLASP